MLLQLLGFFLTLLAPAVLSAATSTCPSGATQYSSYCCIGSITGVSYTETTTVTPSSPTTAGVATPSTSSITGPTTPVSVTATSTPNGLPTTQLETFNPSLSIHLPIPIGPGTNSDESAAVSTFTSLQAVNPPRLRPRAAAEPSVSLSPSNINNILATGVTCVGSVATLTGTVTVTPTASVGSSSPLNSAPSSVASLMASVTSAAAAASGERVRRVEFGALVGAAGWLLGAF